MHQIISNNKNIELSEEEWILLKKHIIDDTLNFWYSVTKEVDSGLLPNELVGGEKFIDRGVLFSLRSKLDKLT